MKIRTFHHEPAGKINVTPLIDVVMVLIIFFLLVGRIAADRSAFVRLPASNQGDATATPGVTVAVLPPDATSGGVEPVVLVDATQFALADVAAALRARLPELAAGTQSTPILLRADRTLPYAAVEPVIRACREAGAVSLRLIASRTGHADGKGEK